MEVLTYALLGAALLLIFAAAFAERHKHRTTCDALVILSFVALVVAIVTNPYPDQF